MGFSLKRWLLATLTRRDLGLTQIDWKYLRFSCSQFGEDLIVSSLLPGASGFYVDVGAYHPAQISNTYLLYRRGWRGVVIDANPDLAAPFRRRRPRDILVSAAVSDAPGDGWFEVREAGPSSSLRQDAGPGPAPGVERVVKVRVRTLASILNEHLPARQAIDYLDVDCEGADLAVLRSNDWQRYRPKVISVEDAAPRATSAICGLLTQRGYEFFAETGVTRLFKDPEAFRATPRD